MKPFPSSTTCGGPPSPEGRLTVETLLLPPTPENQILFMVYTGVRFPQ